MILNPTTPTRINPPRVIHPVEGRDDIAYELDFIVNAKDYAPPTYGSNDEYGTLILESATTHNGGGVLQFTRTYITEVPAAYDEVCEYTLQHDEFIDLPKSYNTVSFYYRYTKDGLGRLVEPVPPDSGDLPEGAELRSTVQVPAGYINDGVPVWVPSTYYSAGGYWTQAKVFSLGGIRWTFAYEVDPVTKENLYELKRLAAVNFTLSDSASTVSVPVKTVVHRTYHVLPNGPQAGDHIPPTDKVNTYGGSVIGWERSETTRLTPTEFKTITGCLYERSYRTYIGL